MCKFSNIKSSKVLAENQLPERSGILTRYIAIALRKDRLDKTSYAVSTKEFITVTEDYKEYKELHSLFLGLYEKVKRKNLTTEEA